MKSTIEVSAAEIARLVEGRLVGDGAVRLCAVASLDSARPEAVSFLGAARFREQALNSRAGLLLTFEELKIPTPQVIVADPYTAFVKVMNRFRPEERPAPGVHPTAVVEAGAEIGVGAHVGPLATIGAGATIGSGAVVGAGATVGAGAEVGAESVLHPRVTLYPGVKIGRRTIVHSGTVIGSDGFGFVLSDRGHVKKPQVGTVIVEDEVEIGANCAIDRAMLDATVIGAGSKFDNLVHIAHGVRVGRHCIILAHTVVGGGVKIGDDCVISGNVVIKDNVTLGDRVMVVGGSGVADDVAAGEVVWGYPALPFRQAQRVYARLKQLPELWKRFRALEKKVLGPADDRTGNGTPPGATRGGGNGTV